jgi:hypothetical protein
LQISNFEKIIDNYKYDHDHDHKKYCGHRIEILSILEDINIFIKIKDLREMILDFIPFPCSFFNSIVVFKFPSS